MKQCLGRREKRGCGRGRRLTEAAGTEGEGWDGGGGEFGGKSMK